MSRLAGPLCVAFALTLTGLASAHGTPPGAGFRSTISGMEPVVPGLLVRVVDGERISVSNWSNTEIVIEGPSGRPLYRFADRRVDVRTNGRWRSVKRGESHVWHDPRIHWVGPAPGRSGIVDRFEISATADGRPLSIKGFGAVDAAARERPHDRRERRAHGDVVERHHPC